MTRKELIKEAAQKEMSKYPNFCITAPSFRMGAEWAFDFALQEAKSVVLEHFGIEDKHADEVEDLFNKLEERLGK